MFLAQRAKSSEENTPLIQLRSNSSINYTQDDFAEGATVPSVKKRTKVAANEDELISLDDGNLMNGKIYTMKVYKREIEHCDEIMFPIVPINSLFSIQFGLKQSPCGWCFFHTLYNTTSTAKEYNLILEGQAVLKPIYYTYCEDKIFVLNTKHGNILPHPTLEVFLTWQEYLHEKEYVIIELRINKIDVIKKRGNAVFI